METLSRNEEIAVQRCIKKGCEPTDNKNLENIKDNTFMIEVPLHFFVQPQTFNANCCEIDLAKYLSKKFKNEELEKSVLTNACRRNLTFNSGLLRIDLAIFKNGIWHLFELNDESTHYVKNSHFDLAHRCFSDFIKSKLLSKKEGVVFKEIPLFGTLEQKTKTINRIIDKTLKDGR